MTLSKSFEGKTIAITGAASGIGLATAHFLAQRGARLSLADLDVEALRASELAIRESCPSIEILSTVLDVRMESDVERWITNTVKTFGSLSGAANLAGVFGKCTNIANVAEMERADWDFVIGVNLTGLFNCIKAELKVVKAGASIVNAASLAGLQGAAKCAAYCASKHGVVGLTNSAAKEVGDKEIRVNCICPGIIETPMIAAVPVIHGISPINRRGTAGEVAALIGYLLGDESTFITGSAFPIDGGIR